MSIESILDSISSLTVIELKERTDPGWLAGVGVKRGVDAREVVDSDLVVVCDDGTLLFQRASATGTTAVDRLGVVHALLDAENLRGEGEGGEREGEPGEENFLHTKRIAWGHAAGKAFGRDIAARCGPYGLHRANPAA